MKISPSVNLEKLYQLFYDHWLILQAELLVYVTGQIEDDASEFWEKIFHHTFFSNDHTSVVITNGTYSKLTETLAKAIQSRWAEKPYCKSSLLGIPIWQQIQNKEQLIGQMVVIFSFIMMLEDILTWLITICISFHCVYQNEGKYPTMYTSLHENETAEQEVVPLVRNHEYYALLEVEDCERANETRIEVIAALKKYLTTTWVPGTDCLILKHKHHSYR